MSNPSLRERIEAELDNSGGKPSKDAVALEKVLKGIDLLAIEEE